MTVVVVVVVVVGCEGAKEWMALKVIMRIV